MRGRTLRRASLLISALAIVTMGTVTVACTPRTEQPADPSVSEIAPSEKNVRTNVTRTGMSVAPPGVGGSRPCGFGPGGGGPCHHRHGGYGGDGGDGGGGGGGD